MILPASDVSRQDTTLLKTRYLGAQLPLPATSARAWVRRSLWLRVAEDRQDRAGVGHDGGLYRGAGATFCGPGAQGRLLFAWALDPALRVPLAQLGRAVEERHG